MGLRLFFLVLIFNGFQSFGQTPSFELAQSLAQRNEYEKALEMCDYILGVQKNNFDVINLKGWIASQLDQYSLAIQYYELVLSNESLNYDAAFGLVNNLYWKKDYSQSLKIINHYLQFYGRDINFLWVKVKNLIELREFTEALYYLDQIIGINPKFKEAKTLRAEISNSGNSRLISLLYYKESYASFYEKLDIVQIEYFNKLKWGTIGGRFQNGYRGIQTGYQFELESYPKLWKGSYGFFNISFSNQSIFPIYRISIDWNQAFLRSYGLILGLRSFQYNARRLNISKIALEKYLGSFRIEGSAFLLPGDTGTSITFLLNIKKYFAKSTNNFYFAFGNAISPDSQGRIDDSGDIYQLKSKQFQLGFEWQIFPATIIVANSSFMKNELPFALGDFINGNILTFGLRKQI